FTEEMNKTRILALIYASEVLNSNGYYDLADKKREKAKHLSKSSGVVMDDAFINDLRKSRSGDYYG
ncbi:MAG: hypothetical protein KAJ24_02415, partial [Candidatus Aenigmarchaeota archaeon]|nr:hypothetical protein [Candidatus Aenigmarchaeota archaeon]